MTMNDINKMIEDFLRHPTLTTRTALRDGIMEMCEECRQVGFEDGQDFVLRALKKFMKEF